MKAFCKTDVGRFSYRELAEPQLRTADDVKIRVAYTTICSDENKDIGTEDYFSKDQVAGHEMSGIVTALGENAKEQGFNIGDRVGGLSVLPCGHCRMCRSGRSHCCLEMRYTTGTLCEYIVWNYRQLTRLPPNASMQAGCLIDPLAAALQALERASIQVGDYVAVFGAGFNGLMLTRLAKMRGAALVAVIEPLESRRQLALQYGADCTADPNATDIQIVLSDLTGFTGFDKIFETSANFSALSLATRLLARGGTLLSCTYYSYYQKTQLNMTQMYLDNLTIGSLFYPTTSWISPAKMLPQFHCEELITKEFPFSEAELAYRLEKQKMHIKIAIRLPG